MKRIHLYLLFTLVTGILHAQSLAQRLDSLIFNDPLLRTSEVGITVFDLTTGESLFRYQDEKLYRPASTEKIVTSVTALSTLGTDYTMNTRLQYTGQIENDTLKGSHYLVGGFDPDLMDAEASIDIYGLPRGYNPDLGAYVYTPETPQPYQP